jgi:glucokinase
MSPPANIIGIDFGGTYVRSALVSRAGDLRHFTKTASRADESDEAPIEAIVAAARELMALADGPMAIGVGAPGVIHPITGAQIGETPHLPHWTDFPLRERLRSRLGIDVVTDNDANLAALAEHRVGAARGARVSIMVTVGTGVGCGIVIDDRVFRGGWGGAGEIGHLPLGNGEQSCRCGVEHCVEPEMSGSGVSRTAVTLGLSTHEATSVFAAASRGAAAELEITERLTDRLGAAIGTAVNLLNPEMVVVGGGLAQGGDDLLKSLRRSLARYALASHRRGLRVVAARLGERAGVVGAGLAAWDALGQESPPPSG